jgi:hypothetical protein
MTMLVISGNCRGRNRVATFEANQLDEGWEIVVRCAGDRIEETTLALSPYALIEKLTTEAFERAGKQAPPTYDLTKRKGNAPREEKRKVRKQPHGLVTEPDNAEKFDQQLAEMIDAKGRPQAV